jgi:hypothetical protein
MALPLVPLLLLLLCLRHLYVQLTSLLLSYLLPRLPPAAADRPAVAAALLLLTLAVAAAVLLLLLPLLLVLVRAAGSHSNLEACQQVNKKAVHHEPVK